MGVSQKVQVDFLRSRPAPTPHRISLRLKGGVGKTRAEPAVEPEGGDAAPRE